MFESMFPTKIDSIEYEMNTQIFTFKFGNSTNPTDITNSDRQWGRQKDKDDWRFTSPE